MHGPAESNRVEFPMAEWIETFKGAVLASEYDSETHMNSQIYV